MRLRTLTTLALAIFVSVSVEAAIMEVSGPSTSLDLGTDGTVDFSIAIDVFGDADALVMASADSEVLIPGGPFPASAIRAYRETDIGILSGPGIVPPASYSGFNVTVVDGSGNPNASAGFVAGNNNYVGLRFRDANINSGNLTYGFAQIDAQNDAATILRVVFEDSGMDITIGDVITFPVELLQFSVE